MTAQNCSICCLVTAADLVLEAVDLLPLRPLFFADFDEPLEEHESSSERSIGAAIVSAVRFERRPSEKKNGGSVPGFFFFILPSSGKETGRNAFDTHGALGPAGATTSGCSCYHLAAVELPFQDSFPSTDGVLPNQFQKRPLLSTVSRPCPVT